MATKKKSKCFIILTLDYTMVFLSISSQKKSKVLILYQTQVALLKFSISYLYPLLSSSWCVSWGVTAKGLL